MSMQANRVHHPEVSTLTLNEAMAAHEGLSSLIDMATALLCQPRFGSHRQNAAGELIDRLCDQMYTLREDAAAVIAAAAPTDHWDRMQRAEIMLRRAASEIEDPPELERIAAALAVWPR